MYKKKNTPDAIQFGWFYRLLQRFVNNSGDSKLSELLNDFLMPRFLDEAQKSPIKAALSVVRAIAFFYPHIFFSASFSYVKERITTKHSKDTD